MMEVAKSLIILETGNLWMSLKDKDELQLSIVQF